jgi:hypothetical protein
VLVFTVLIPLRAAVERQERGDVHMKTFAVHSKSHTKNKEGKLIWLVKRPRKSARKI